jgi:hypothetical protein
MGLPTIGTITAIRTAAAASSDSQVVTMVAGRAYSVLIAKTTGSTTRSFSASDDAGNTYSDYVESAGTNVARAAAHSTICTTGGSVTVTVTVSGGTTNFAWQVGEVVPASGTLSIGGTGLFDDSGATTSHQSAPVTGFSPAADSAVFGVGAGTGGSTFGTPTQGAGYTLQGNSSTFMTQTRTTSSLLTDEQVPWTSSSSRQCRGVAVWVGESAGSSFIAPRPIVISQAVMRAANF